MRPHASRTSTLGKPLFELEIAGPAALYVLFALLATAGAYLVLAHHRGRSAGVLAAVLTLLFFGGLGAALVSVLSERR